MKSTVFKLFGIALTAIVGFGALNTAPVFAIDDVCNSSASNEVKAAAGCNAVTANQLPNIIINILKAVIGIAGLVAVIFVIIGGVSYMTSTGDPGKIKKAKDTILYAIIGLVVCALAFAIVNFVIGNILK